MRDTLKIDGEPLAVSASVAADGSAQVSIDGSEYALGHVSREGDELRFDYEGKTYCVHLRQAADFIEVTDGVSYERYARVVAGAVEEEDEAGELTSQMPGTVLKLLAEPGTEVAKGTPLLILEAMKMEHEVCAPADGTVTGFPHAEGARVMPGDLLVDFMAAES
jgi:3-methylcrotonyl-CoA carboxylase alpha subunit